MTDAAGRSLVGTFFHAPVRGDVEVLADTLVAVVADGVIAAVLGPDDPARAAAEAAAREAGTLTRLAAGACVLPGFVDLHIHAPQYPQLGKALHVPLETWLQTFTFPLEARYADLAFARRAYGALVDDLLANGTTTALMFGTVHAAATSLLADLAIERGLRALVGKVAMDHPDACPDFYRDPSVAAAVEGTLAVIEHVRGHSGNRRGRVEAVVTPRFIPACTDPLLDALGDLAARCGCAVQTHCSESDWEHGHVLTRHGMSDAARMAVIASRMLEDGVDPARPSAERGRPGSRIDWITAFHLATAGGADALDLPVGRFALGCRFDALMIDLDGPGASVRIFDEVDDPLDVLQKILHGAGRADIAAVWVDGARVAGRLVA